MDENFNGEMAATTHTPQMTAIADEALNTFDAVATTAKQNLQRDSSPSASSLASANTLRTRKRCRHSITFGLTVLEATQSLMRLFPQSSTVEVKYKPSNGVFRAVEQKGRAGDR